MKAIRRIFALAAMAVIANACVHTQPGKSADKISAGKLIPDSKVNDFLASALSSPEGKEIFSTDKVVDRELLKPLLSAEDSLELIKMTNLLDKEDIGFMYKQLKQAGTFKLEAKFLPGRILISADTLLLFNKNGEISSFWESYRNHYGKGGFCSLSRPLFSKNGNTVAIKSGYYNGELRQHSNLYVFKKTSGIWMLVYSHAGWMS